MHSHIQILKHDPESRIPENMSLPKSKFQGAQIINTSSTSSGGNVDYLRSFDNRFEVNWPPEPTLVLRWISKFFLFGALPSDTLKIKHTKNLKEIPSRHVLENLPEKACMNAFIHLKLISNVQGFN